ncbi:MAG: glycyl-radical enzyme activating protein [Defluviitaleaceae bacterium]|nr:glycyl-radical enzyme activating protein [Defluviitaleaceae bacterium]
MKTESAIIFNIQRFSLHDGDGIRTTFFFKGCPLSCKWCHNPEGQSYEPQVMFFADRCRSCANCSSITGAAENCDYVHSHSPGGGCIYGAREVVGKAYTPQELINIAEKDAEFYQNSGGGVTLSGGEVLTQPPAFLHSLTSGLKRKGFHVAIDTCGHVPFQAFENILPYTDVFLYDVKLFNSAKHSQFTGHGNQLILENLKKLSDTGAKIEIRIPIIEGANNNEEIDAIMHYLSQNIRVEKIRLLPYHAIGTDKYKRIGMAAKGQFLTPGSQRMNELAEKFKKCGLPIAYNK